MDLTPEWMKEATGSRRYERLIGAAEGVAFSLDAAKELIETYTPPKKGHSWQLPTKEELRKLLKEATESYQEYRRKIKQFEAEIIAAEWKVN